MSQDDQSDLIDSGPSSEQRVLRQYPTWPSTVSDQVIVEAIVGVARATDLLHYITITWGEADQECDRPDVEVDIDIVCSDGHHVGVGCVVTPDDTPVIDRWDAVGPPWAVQAIGAIQSACDVLADDVVTGVERALDDGVPPTERWRAATRAFRLLAALIRTETRWFDDPPSDSTDSTLARPQEHRL